MSTPSNSETPQHMQMQMQMHSADFLCSSSPPAKLHLSWFYSWSTSVNLLSHTSTSRHGLGELALILQYLRSGWPNHCNPDFQLYESRKGELSLLDGCIIWGNRVVIPLQGRATVLQELHEGHPGMARMKSLARMYVWWPGMDKGIENSVATSQTCQLQQAKPPVAPLHLWKWPTWPWTRLILRGL